MREWLEEQRQSLDSNQFYWYARGVLYTLRVHKIISGDEWNQLKREYCVIPR